MFHITITPPDDCQDVVVARSGPRVAQPAPELCRTPRPIEVEVDVEQAATLRRQWLQHGAITVEESNASVTRTSATVEEIPSDGSHASVTTEAVSVEARTTSEDGSRQPLFFFPHREMDQHGFLLPPAAGPQQVGTMSRGELQVLSSGLLPSWADLLALLCLQTKATGQPTRPNPHLKMRFRGEKLWMQCW